MRITPSLKALNLLFRLLYYNQFIKSNSEIHLFIGDIALHREAVYKTGYYVHYYGNLYPRKNPVYVKKDINNSENCITFFQNILHFCTNCAKIILLTLCKTANFSGG